MQILTVVQEFFENPAVTFLIEKPFLLNFVSLSTIFYPKIVDLTP